MCAGAGMSLWMPYSAREDPEPLAVPQLVDPDAFLCRQVGISFHIERSTFSPVVDLTLPTIEQVLRFYLEPGRLYRREQSR